MDKESELYKTIAGTLGESVATDFERAVRDDVFHELRLKRLFKRLVLGSSALALAGSVGVAEYFARQTVESWRRDFKWERDTGTFEVFPYTMHGKPPYGQADLDRTIFGYHPWEDLDKLDIVFLGGSVAAGAGSQTYENTYFRQASDLTGRAVVSAAWPGYVSAQEMIALQLNVLPRIRGHGAKNIVLISGVNDIYGPMYAQVPALYPFNWWFVKKGDDVSAFLGERSALVKLFVQHRMAKYGPKTPFNLEKIVSGLEVNLHSMAVQCGAERHTLTYVLQPHGYVLRLNDMKLKGENLPIDVQDRYYDLQEIWLSFRDNVQRICEEEGIEFLDATYSVPLDKYPKSPAEDLIHFNDEGQFIFANYLIENLPKVFGQKKEMVPQNRSVR